MIKGVKSTSQVDKLSSIRETIINKRGYNKRIALFTGNYISVTDGVARTLNRLVSYLEDIGYSVLIFGPSAPNTTDQEYPGYVPVPSIPVPSRKEYKMSLGMSGAVREKLIAFNPDLIHIATPDLLGLAALRWAQNHRKPVVATYHTHFPTYFRFYHLNGLKDLAGRYLRWFYKKCQHVYVPTFYLKDYFSERGLKDNIKVWGRGVDRDVFNPGWRSETWRLDLGIRQDEVLLTFVGRLVKEKGLDVFASVVEKLQAEGLLFRSMIVGDGPLRRTLESRLAETRFTGHLEGRELSRAYASSDVFLFPSETEAFGNVIVEAMASGLPVVCARSSSSSHIRHGETGLISPPEDMDAFYSHTRRLILNQEQRMGMAARAREKARMYDWETVLRAMSNYYEEVLMKVEDISEFSPDGSIHLKPGPRQKIQRNYST